jgi:hypothetical protein
MFQYVKGNRGAAVQRRNRPPLADLLSYFLLPPTPPVAQGILPPSRPPISAAVSLGSTGATAILVRESITGAYRHCIRPSISPTACADLQIIEGRRRPRESNLRYAFGAYDGLAVWRWRLRRVSPPAITPDESIVFEIGLFHWCRPVSPHAARLGCKMVATAHTSRTELS